MPYKHLTLEERYAISHLLLIECSYREIGRRLGRSHTTIKREVERNGEKYSRYWYTYTHQTALERRKRANHKRRQTNDRLMRYVRRKLKQKWSPEEITGRLKIDYPSDLSMRMSHEAIYSWVYKMCKTGETLNKHLRRGRKRRRKQHGYGTGRGLVANRKSIHDRSKAVDLRNRYGDWEGDSVLGSQGTGTIMTHIERKSLYLIAAKLSSKEAADMTQATIQKFKKIPQRLKQTLTVDNGKEFFGFAEVEERTKLKVYFADPYASWQRGCNENLNGLLRQYFPKGSDFTKVTDEDVAKAVRSLNSRPRKSLGYQTPSEVFRSL